MENADGRPRRPKSHIEKRHLKDEHKTHSSGSVTPTRTVDSLVDLPLPPRPSTSSGSRLHLSQSSPAPATKHEKRKKEKRKSKKSENKELRASAPSKVLEKSTSEISSSVNSPSSPKEPQESKRRSLSLRFSKKSLKESDKELRRSTDSLQSLDSSTKLNSSISSDEQVSVQNKVPKKVMFSLDKPLIHSVALIGTKTFTYSYLQ